MKPFAHQIAIVTGASSGIGRALALLLAAQGAIVHALGRRAEALQDVEQKAACAGGCVLTHRFDLRSDADLAAFVMQVSRVDILVHSAGVLKLGSFFDSPAADMDWHYQVNLRAPYLLTQLLLPKLVGSRGQVVFLNTGADRDRTNSACKGHYAATKHALLALADSLRDEVNAGGVRVLSVFPGRVASPMQQSLHEAEAREYFPDRLIQPEDVADVILNALLLPRTAEITNISIRPMLK
jgi:NAD(P)-dependent dehydrogenase (short-subunit alcohol dehydrogenase family)